MLKPSSPADPVGDRRLLRFGMRYWDFTFGRRVRITGWFPIPTSSVPKRYLFPGTF
jgi:1-acyl-sn-glycerol-3-phosphate acyltransferase